MLFDDMVDGQDDDEFRGFDDLLDETELSPESLISSRMTEDLFGHQEIEQKLLHMLEVNRFPHGLIFSGPAGIGKSVMAYRLTRFLFSEADREPDMFGEPEPATSLYVEKSHSIFAKVASGGYPDLLTIERPIDEATGRVKASVPVEEIRKIAPFMRKTASVKDGWRIVIVNDADTMTRSSQNSLLKILEEPPEKSLLILIAHRAGALLPTVYSRCVHLPFHPLERQIIDDALSNRVPPVELPLISAMAEGSLGRAYDYAQPDQLDLISKSLAYIGDWPNFNWTDVQSFAETFGTKGNDDAQRVFRETMMWVATSLIRGKTDGTARLEKLQNSLSVEAKLKLYDTLLEHFDRCIMGHLDKRFLILGAFMAFEV